MGKGSSLSSKVEWQKVKMAVSLVKITNYLRPPTYRLPTEGQRPYVDTRKVGWSVGLAEYAIL